MRHRSVMSTLLIAFALLGLVESFFPIRETYSRTAATEACFRCRPRFFRWRRRPVYFRSMGCGHRICSPYYSRPVSNPSFTPTFNPQTSGGHTGNTTRPIAQDLNYNWQGCSIRTFVACTAGENLEGGTVSIQQVIGKERQVLIKNEAGDTLFGITCPN